MSSTTFAGVSALTDIAPGCFTAEVDERWTIGGKPNGGYLLAILGRAAARVGQHPHVIAASAHYLHSPVPGPITVEAIVLRAGRSASQLRVRLLQDGQPCVEALFTTSRLDEASVPYWDRGVLGRSAVAMDACVRIPPVTPTGLSVPMMAEIDLRMEPATLGFADGAPSGRGELRGWLALPEDEPFDPTALLFAVDAFPPATFEIEATGWVPTLELTAYVRALPAPGPVQVVQRAHLVQAQRVDEGCSVWDSAGRLVAQGTQLAGIRLG